MPNFMVEGKSKTTGRKLKPRRYLAIHADAAKAQAKKDGIVPEKVELLKVDHFTCVVAGTSHSNPDGKERQTIVKKCKRFEPILLRHEIGNRHDKHAVQTLRSTGEQIGYIPKELAHLIVDGYSTNGPCLCAAVSLGTCPLGDAPNLVSMRLLVVFAIVGTERELIDAYIQGLSSEKECNNAIEQFPSLSALKSVETRHERKKKGGCFGVILIAFGMGLGCVVVLFLKLILSGNGKS